MKMTKNVLFPAALLSIALLVACGGGSPAAETPAPEASPADDSPEEETEGATPKKFSEMSAPEKMNHMKKVITPGMAKVFQEASEEKYSDFSCTVCHGPGAKQGKFSMPAPGLLPLNQEEMDEHPEVTKFMMERVVPEMASLMGEEPYDPETQEGFGCYACHSKKE